MALRLRALPEEETAAFVASVRDAYTREMVTDGGMSEREAGAKAERDFAMLLRDGRPIEGQQLFVVEEAESGERLGRVWLGEGFGGQPVGFLYDIHIEPRLRGRGFGREAMLLVGDEARRCGFPEIRLNVFGGNEVARSLYRSLGYAEFAIAMRKRLS
jgi:ribosomal protein S18 acetylase RimI-like enzyme